MSHIACSKPWLATAGPKALIPCGGRTASFIDVPFRTPLTKSVRLSRSTYVSKTVFVASVEGISEDIVLQAVPPAQPVAREAQEQDIQEGKVERADADYAGRMAFTTEFKLNVLWQDEFCAVAVDQLVHMNQKDRNVYRTPITEYFIWPKVDAWEEVKAALDAKPWIPDRDTILVLNSLTDIVNYWQELHTKADAQEKFGDQVTFEA